MYALHTMANKILSMYTMLQINDFWNDHDGLHQSFGCYSCHHLKSKKSTVTFVDELHCGVCGATMTAASHCQTQCICACVSFETPF